MKYTYDKPKNISKQFSKVVILIYTPTSSGQFLIFTYSKKSEYTRFAVKENST